jgi:hypothetical protein
VLPESHEGGGIGRSVVRRVLKSIRCGACGASYSQEDLAIVERHDGVWLLTAVCSSCDFQATVMVVVQYAEDEMDRRQPALCWDDVLDFHTWIQHYGGDFRGVLDWE